MDAMVTVLVFMVTMFALALVLASLFDWLEWY